MTNETQQTVLQFYNEQYCILELQFEKHEITFDEFQVKRNQLYNKAKEMEKKQSNKDYQQGYQNGYQNGQMDLMK
jgi:hypothetical protein